MQESVALHTGGEKLCDESACTCNACLKPQLATKLTRIHHAPPIRIVQLNRNQKLDCHMDFPALLDIGPYMADQRSSPVVYRLYATINHGGENAQCGH
ncbi:Ubiquitin carboxyl-terminal hydrolase 17-like protein A [Taenia solium]|eukprot:TsM_000375100 transcript=TsM_000375100 gene=TsM_000375100